MSSQLADDRVAEVEARSAGLKKELGLIDLVLMQIMYVVGSAWVGTAAKLGTDHTVFWLLAILFYYLPQAAVVIFLARLMPLEGGLYQWTSIALGRFAGFMVAWNLWAYAVLIGATFGVTIATNAAYVLSGSSATLLSTSWYTPMVSVLALLGVTIIAVLGLRVGRWVQDVGGAAHVLTFAALLIVPFVAIAHGRSVGYHPLRVTAPKVTPLSLNIFGKMGLGALSGFEYVAIMAGETRSASRTITRSVLVAAPIIALMFILGTDSVIALVPRDRIDLASPIPQALSVGFAGSGIVGLLAPVLILMLVLRQIGVVTMVFNGNTRLPLVTGWDNLLPSWFARLDPRFGTPVNSILFVSAITIAFSIAGQIGVGVQEAFQLLDNAAGILYALTYLGLFAIPLFGAANLQRKPPLWLKIASASGFVMSLLYSTLSVFPIIDVPSWRVFAAKIITVILVANVIGFAIYLGGNRTTSHGRASG
ncbi:MAG TPA: APC family permease [Gemmatimonadaceae bacterium]|nr:APC family permease [Gemmatimonadaceae bacterium]